MSEQGLVSGLEAPGASEQDGVSERRVGAPGASEQEVVDPEDRKIITLARASRARSGAAQGAAVRDRDGRTYAATNIALEALSLSAVQLAVAMAVSSGAPGLEAVAVVGEHGPDSADRSLVAEVAGQPVTVWVAGPDGSVREQLEVSADE